jgi:hypothetical protein
MTVKLGQVVTDRMTGFSGTVVARTEYLYGCVQICLNPGQLKDRKPLGCEWFDEQRLTNASEATSGGPSPVPPELPRPS